MMETKELAQNIEEVAAVPGLDSVCIGQVSALPNANQ